MTTYCIWKKTTILLLQFAKNRMSISSKLRPQEEVKNVSSKRNTLYIHLTLLNLCLRQWKSITHDTFQYPLARHYIFALYINWMGTAVCQLLQVTIVFKLMHYCLTLVLLILHKSLQNLNDNIIHTDLVL